MAHSITSLTDEQIKAPALLAKKQNRKKPIKLLVAVLAVIGGISYYAVWQNQPQPAVNVLQLSGRIDGYETEIGVKRSARIELITVREGEMVKKGQKLVQLDDSNDQVLQGQLHSAEAKINVLQYQEQQAKEEIEQVKAQIEQVKSQIQEAQLNFQQSQGNAQGEVTQARSQVAAAKAQLVQAQAQIKLAQAELKLAKINHDRYAKLVNEGAINQQQFDQAQAALDTAIATLEARKATANAETERLNAAQGSLTQAKTSAFNPGIRNAQIKALQEKQKQDDAQLNVAQAQLKAAQSQVEEAQASKQQIVTQIQDSKKDLNVVSPIEGVVTARNVEIGAVVTSQTKLLKLVDPNTVYLRGFIPEGDIGKVRVGQKTKIFLDSAPQHPLKGKVIAIDPQASFTPENIYFQKDRVRQVVGIRISVQNPAGCFNPNQPYTGTDLPCAKIGMPADAEILLKSKESEQ
ncbi:HlyD family secretion protein [Nostoc sp. WHI]|uniref:HlyD family secretion protein n=1 Tax=Nostoc sp. WHI TaxID=2650611 RepID=UPI0018C75094|nr:HlyD family efflux transporter periplasmic adaptor subunit [Nostoc sp. WHI]MBG1271046.1 HlyD family efflux transporter periplasmic adaptor subunit [Nostoc sp. WHI]